MPATVSVVVPVYNAQHSLPLLVDRLLPVLQACAQQAEILLVNDGSRDQSWSVIQTLAAQHPDVRGIDLMRNYGQHNATLCGLRAARYAVTVTMDDDLQNPPEEMPRMLATLEEDVDVVYGNPQHEAHGLFRHLASRITKLALQHALGAKGAGQISSFRAFRTCLRDGFANYHGPHVFLDSMLSWTATRFAAIPVRNDPRTVGASNYTARMLISYALNMIISFSTLPLRLATIVGFCFAVFGVGVLLYVLAEYLLKGAPVPGFPFLASVIAIFSGAQLFSLGILGEYLARVHSRMMDRPGYTVRSATDDAVQALSRGAA